MDADTKDFITYIKVVHMPTRHVFMQDSFYVRVEKDDQFVAHVIPDFETTRESVFSETQLRSFAQRWVKAFL